MQIEALRLFCDVARLRSFSRAAEANHVQQATASLAVQRLEAHLGVALIDRSHRPWRLTPAGRKFYLGCKEVVERYERLEAVVSGRGQALRRPVRVAAIYSVNLRDMSRCVRQFNEQRPGAHVELEYLHPGRVCERVLNDEVDLGILSFPEGLRGLSVIPWRTEPMVLACHPEHPLAREQQVAVGRLRGEAFVGFDAGLVIRKKIDAYLREHGAEVRVVLTFDNVEAVKRAVEAGTGVALLPLPTLENELRVRTLAAVPLAPPGFARPLGFVHRRGHPLHPNAAFFVQLLLGLNRPANWRGTSAPGGQATAKIRE